MAKTSLQKEMDRAARTQCQAVKAVGLRTAIYYRAIATHCSSRFVTNIGSARQGEQGIAVDTVQARNHNQHRQHIRT